jgi:hypothetical protein
MATKENDMETNLQYVQRRLSEPSVNIAGLSKELGISRFILDKLAHGGEVRFSVVETIYKHFKNNAE